MDTAGNFAVLVDPPLIAGDTILAEDAQSRQSAEIVVLEPWGRKQSCPSPRSRRGLSSSRRCQMMRCPGSPARSGRPSAGPCGRSSSGATWPGMRFGGGFCGRWRSCIGRSLGQTLPYIEPASGSFSFAPDRPHGKPDVLRNQDASRTKRDLQTSAGLPLGSVKLRPPVDLLMAAADSQSVARRVGTIWEQRARC